MPGWLSGLNVNSQFQLSSGFQSHEIEPHIRLHSWGGALLGILPPLPPHAHLLSKIRPKKKKNV